MLLSNQEWRAAPEPPRSRPSHPPGLFVFKGQSMRFDRSHRPPAAPPRPIRDIIHHQLDADMKLLAAGLLLSAAALTATAQPVSFAKQVKPILARNCEGCHHAASRQSGLSLATFADFAKGGNKGPAFVKG